MTHENPNQDESPADEQDTNNHANIVARQLRLADQETREEIGAESETVADARNYGDDLDDDDRPVPPQVEPPADQEDAEFVRASELLEEGSDE